MRRKLAAMLLAVVLAAGLLSLSACGGTGETSGPDGSEPPKQSDTSGTPRTSNPPTPTTTPPTTTPPTTTPPATTPPTTTPPTTTPPTPEPPAGEDPSSPINLTISGNYSVVNDPPNVEHYDWMEDVVKQVSLDGCYVLSPEAQLTVSNLANADGCYIQIRLYTPVKMEGVYGLDDPYFFVLTNKAGFIANMLGAGTSPEYGGGVHLRPGESATFSISEYAAVYDEDTGEEVYTYDFLVLLLGLYYPDDGQWQWAYYGFVY